MNNTKTTKRALFASALALFLCFTMLLGTTFAWFSDTKTSSGNIIQSGTLKIDFDKYDEENGAWTAVNGPLFNYDKWEPGYTQVVNLRVVNKGTLALKWQATITTEKTISILADAINVYVKSDDRSDSVKILSDSRVDLEAEVAANTMKKFTLREFMNNLTVMTNGVMQPNQESYLTIVLQMDPYASDEYQGLDLGGKFDLSILATQLAYESDSFGPDYDALANFNGSSIVPVNPGESAIETDVWNSKNEKIASVNIPTSALVDGATNSTVVINDDSSYVPNITVASGSEMKTFDISVSNIKSDNTDPIKVQLKLPLNLDPATVLIYHYDALIPSSYNPYTGVVSFESASFSPFSLVYGTESSYVPPVADPNGIPAATVVAQPAYVGVSLPWGSYGSWVPNDEVDSDPKLEAAYLFTAAQTYEEALASPYANWECDFFVKLDRDLKENQIFLGGNYGSFGWVGFHNYDLELPANEEVPLLGSVTNNPWTYLDVVQFVGTFTCGVGDVNDALSGATFTVTLRLTNPETGETIDVSTINHTFN